MKKPEEYLGDQPCLYTVLGMEAFTKPIVLGLISRVQRETVERCLHACGHPLPDSSEAWDQAVISCKDAIRALLDKEPRE